jgi:enoyl-[acyl-carrier protein] reductase III
MISLSGKRALVTGSTRGLGKAIALRFARAGARVALTYRRDDENAERTFAEIRSLSPGSLLIKSDLEKEEEVRAMVETAAREFDCLDIYVANAAATAFKPLLDTKPHNLLRTFVPSVSSFVTAVQEISRVMPDGGRIVAVSGIDSARYLPGHGLLGAAKAALESMVRYFAFELGPREITVNGINLCLIETESSQLYLKDIFNRAAKESANRCALGRMPRLDEIAAVVSFLASDDASFVTGQTLMVDGGVSVYSPVSAF